MRYKCLPRYGIDQISMPPPFHRDLSHLNPMKYYLIGIIIHCLNRIEFKNVVGNCSKGAP